MNDTTDAAISGILDLTRWYLDAMRLHSADLTRITKEILTGQATDLGYAEMRRCALLDKAVYTLALQAYALLRELRVELPTTPAQTAEIDELRAEYDRLTEAWRAQMEGVHYVWVDGKPPQ